jgi:23S rRNA (cytidine1920-2'-O)/16S rRNA (cytidine1409-2'-O)-methyltransferase
LKSKADRPAASSIRADSLLVQRGLARSRAEASAAIEAGGVRANGQIISKPSQLLAQDVELQFIPAHPFVSRGGIKLAAALDAFALSCANAICLDLGASTGGFTQVLLEREAARVYAVDVGHGQLSPELRDDGRVVSLEGINARELTAEQIPDRPGAIVADVSFIGLKLALPKALEFAAPGAWLVALFKPQFEVGRAHIGKGGIVRDAAARERALADFTAWISSEQGWTLLGSMQSPITGGDGNVEYLVAARK